MNALLKDLFAPRSVAILGASEKNPWAGLVLATLERIGFDGPIHLVNPRGETVLGRPVVRSATAIGAPVDSAFIMVPATALEETLRDMARAGITKGVVVTSGFAELGEAGTVEQNRLFDLARSLGLTLMGPNSLGFVNMVDRVALTAVPVTLPILPDPKVGVISQSGATAAIISNTAHATNVALTHVVALGNEAMVDMSDAIDFMVADPATKAIAIFAESVRRPDAFIRAAGQALLARKPIVLLKVGVGELAAQVAQAHTGALVGDNRVFDAVCRDLGIIRVDTIEQLLQTANLIGHTGVLGEGGFAAASMSGGACEMIADLGEAQGVPFAALAADTTRQLAATLPAYASTHNPLDVTGGVLANLQAFEDALATIGQDPSVALVAACFDLARTPEGDVLGRPVIAHLTAGIGRSGVPGFLMPQSYLSVSDYGRETLSETGMPLSVAGLGHAMAAVGAAFRWSAKVREGLEQRDANAATARPASRPRTERETLDYLESRGVPVIPARIARSADEAAEFAEQQDGPIVLKIHSPDIAHKTEVGGVALNISGSTAAAREYEAMVARVAGQKPKAAIEGVILSPMRPAGLELIVGIARDPAWGPVLAVGLGGVWVEILKDADLALLPVTPDQVERMLGRLKARKLLDGYRGQPAVDRKKLAQVIAAIGDAALALGPELVSLEINPLRVTGSDVECLDALAIWADQPEDRQKAG
ncbi:acetate--CoA ligase family protein [Sphingobium sp. TKS]|uniref:acetate--CoA ligase family protein n=1 Tax=Sphingobium sp. TKS TaxID=1315974 RepID=UPI00076FE812|nr:acetate--CoA ligase family protein [Sphingobium sp. TKS]AMK25596.1 Acyl-CoA synthetase (NDP forming) [Sphingobium sp. TKS]